MMYDQARDQFLEGCGLSSEEEIIVNLKILNYSNESCAAVKNNFLKNAAIIAKDSDLRNLYKRLGFEQTIEVTSDLLSKLQKLKKNIVDHPDFKSAVKISASKHQQPLKANADPEQLITDMVEISSDRINLQTYQDVMGLMEMLLNIVSGKEDYSKVNSAKYPVPYLRSVLKQTYNFICNAKESTLSTKKQYAPTNQTAVNVTKQKLPLRTPVKPTTTKISHSKKGVREACKETKERSTLIQEAHNTFPSKQVTPLASLFRGQSVIANQGTKRKVDRHKEVPNRPHREDKQTATASNNQPIQSSRNTRLFELFAGQSTLTSRSKVESNRYTTTIKHAESEDEALKPRNAY